MTQERDEILDLIRGLSALMVLLAHVRGFVLLDLGELDSAGLLTKAFYLGTGLHHQAVMIFFVLSGYFVGGTVVASLAQGRFSSRHYALARLSRLWLVLVPALVLTLLLDTAGQSINPGAYAGELRAAFMSGPESGSKAAFAPGDFMGNLFFLQTLSVPVFGSNGPLWSLANEFWYYVLFPLVAVGLTCAVKWCRRPPHGSDRPGSCYLSPVSCLILFACLVFWLPWALVSKGAIWLFGVGVWWASKQPRMMAIVGTPGWRVLTGLGFLGTLAASKTSSMLGSDFAVGLAFALWVPSLLGAWRRPGWWSGLGGGLSAISYTLYVVHFPLLFFIAATRLNGRQFAPDGTGITWFFGLSLASLMVATVMWWMFERRTDRVRRWLAQVLRISPGRLEQALPAET